MCAANLVEAGRKHSYSLYTYLCQVYPLYSPLYFLPIFPSLHPPYLGTRTRQAMRAFNRANPSPELNQTLTQAGRQAMRAFDRADPSPELNQTLTQAGR